MPVDIQGFVFDLDGVLTDTAELHYQSWKRLADAEKLPFTRADNEQLRGVSRRDSLLRLLKGQTVSEETMQAWMERKNTYYLELLKGLTPRDVLPGVLRFLEQATSHGIRLGVGSASRNAREVLRLLDLIDLFDAVGDGYSVANPKPAPDLFVWVAGRMNLIPAQVIVFEDAEAGVEAALKGGFWTVGIGSTEVQKAHLVAPKGIEGLTPQGVIKAMEERVKSA